MVTAHVTEQSNGFGSAVVSPGQGKAWAVPCARTGRQSPGRGLLIGFGVPCCWPRGTSHKLHAHVCCRAVWSGPLLRPCAPAPCRRPHSVFWWTVALQPPSVTLQPPSVTLQPPLVTPHPRLAALKVLSFCVPKY